MIEDINFDLEDGKLEELEKKVDRYKSLTNRFNREKVERKRKAETRLKIQLGGLFFLVGFKGKLDINLLTGILANAKESLDTNSLDVETLKKKGKKILLNRQVEKTTKTDMEAEGELDEAKDVSDAINE